MDCSTAVEEDKSNCVRPPAIFVIPLSTRVPNVRATQSPRLSTVSRGCQMTAPTVVASREDGRTPDQAVGVYANIVVGRVVGRKVGL